MILCKLNIHPFRQIVQSCDEFGDNRTFHKECIFCFKLLYTLARPKKYHPAKWIWEKDLSLKEKNQATKHAKEIAEKQIKRIRSMAKMLR